MKINHLNSKQIEAVDYLDGPVLVLAGPGSGKTTVITYRIRNLIEKYCINPNEILVITFTKVAAEEMRARFLKLFPVEEAKKVTMGTFHSLFFRIISSRYGYTIDNIIREDERKSVLKNFLVRLNLASDEEMMQNLTNELSLIKNELIDVKFHNPANMGTDDFQKIYNFYEEYKVKHNKIDFDDMMVKCHQLLKSEVQVLKFWQNKFKYILVDEFQDINRVQYECVKMLAEPKRNLFIVGDDDQSIYSFRGAKPELLLDFPREYMESKTVILDTNYRSTNNIINLCNKIICTNKVRFEKVIKGTNRVGKSPMIIRPSDINAEARHITEKIKALRETIPFSEIAVIYRTNIQSRAYIDAFMNANIPFQIKDEAPSIYEHWLCTDVLSYMKLSMDTTLHNEAIRIINRPKRFVSKDMIASVKNKKGSLINNLLISPNYQAWQRARLEELLFYLNAIKKRNPYDAYRYIKDAVGYKDYILEYCEYRKIKPKDLLEIYEELQEGSKNYNTLEEYICHVENAIALAKENKQKRDKNFRAGVTLTTLHSAKGLEFEVVFIISAVDGIIPYEKSQTDAEIEEERRMFYVGLTRAKSILYISLVKMRHEQEVKPTMFLKGIIKE